MLGTQLLLLNVIVFWKLISFENPSTKEHQRAMTSYHKEHHIIVK